MVKVGSKVICQFFNTPEEVFYGDRWLGSVIAVDESKQTTLGPLTPLLVKRDNGLCDVWIQRKEVKAVV